MTSRSNRPARVKGPRKAPTPSAVARAIGAAIVAARTRRGIPRRTLAARADVALESLRQYERGAIEPRLSALARIAECLEVPPSSLLDGAGLGASAALAVSPHAAAGAPTLQRAATMLGLTLEFNGAAWTVRPRVHGGASRSEQPRRHGRGARAAADAAKVSAGDQPD